MKDYKGDTSERKDGVRMRYDSESQDVRAEVRGGEVEDERDVERGSWCKGI